MRVAAVRAAVHAAKEKVKIDLYYDVVSPYAWLGFETLNRYKAHWNINLHLKPVLLTGIGKAAGTIAPAMKPNRAPYLVKDLHRSAAYFNVPINFPSDVFELMFVKGSLIPSRFLTAIGLLHPAHLEAASRQLWLAAWSRDEDITSPEVLAAAGLAAGLTPESLAEVKEQMGQPAIKQLLKAHTDEAVGYGAFGVPTIVAHVGGKPALFFGSDRFPILAQEINETWMGPEPGVGSAKL
ncbi:glutathione S-transferase kappa 1-like [Scylla paramamosain]|uniref:glutathione S-transferase kappa 1-like n=1 Tax=Scylla paramamosain TaxID=85552 RepID=UPI0030835D5A